MIHIFISLIIYTIGLVSGPVAHHIVSDSKNIKSSVRVEEKAERVIFKSERRISDKLLTDIIPIGGYVINKSVKDYYSEYIPLQQIPVNRIKNNNHDKGWINKNFK